MIGRFANKLISTGSAEIDEILGGGVFGGTIILIEESGSSTYADALARLFLAEGFHQNHKLFVAVDGSIPATEYIQAIPEIVSEAAGNAGVSHESAPDVDKKLEIAWRYEHLPTQTHNSFMSGSRRTNQFDLSRRVCPSRINNYKHILTYDAATPRSSEYTSHYRSILSQLKQWLDVDTTGRNDPLTHRIVIRQFNSPLYHCNESSETAEIIGFLSTLRALVRQKLSSIVLVTVSTDLVESSAVLQRLRQIADAVFRLDPITETSGNKFLTDYHGFFRCLRTPSVHSIRHPIPEEGDLAFKLRRNFRIEKIHLPPDLSETVSRNQLDSTAGCASGASRSKIDF